LHSFNDLDGYGPAGAPIIGTDGCFYGVTEEGGISGLGTIFKITAEGVFTKLIDFTGENGATPKASLLEGSDGNLYGTTSLGGSSNRGTVFRITRQGTLTTLVNFNGTNGSFPETALIQDTNGYFYGGTSQMDAGGSLFKMDVEGNFIFQQKTLSAPSDLYKDSSGILWGTTKTKENPYQHGTIYTLSASGGINILATFNSSISHPSGPPVQGSDGYMYGLLANGDVYQLRATSLTKRSSPQPSVSETNGGLVKDSNGNLYGTSARGGSSGQGRLFRLSSSGVYEDTVASFYTPQGNHITRLALGTDGYLYGGTLTGGVYGNGTLFKISPSGTLTTLHHFTAGRDRSGLAQDINGNWIGGIDLQDSNEGQVFSITPQGTFTSLSKHTRYHPLGLTPKGFVQGSNGSMYGTAAQGGLDGYGVGRGTVVKISPEGILSTMADFNSGGLQGASPNLWLAEGTSSVFYGTTSSGGQHNKGTIFKYDYNSISVLHHFNNAGRNPTIGVTKGVDGNFYGLTPQGGDHEYGTFYKVTPAGVVTTILHLDRKIFQNDPMVLGLDGNFYLTGVVGEALVSEAIYRLTPTGELTVVHASSRPEPINMIRGLIRGKHGSFYGSIASARSPGGLAWEADQIYHLRLAPKASSQAASNVTNRTATFHGTVTPNSYDNHVKFLYGTDPDFETHMTWDAGVAEASLESSAITSAVTGLKPFTTYYCRVASYFSEGQEPILGEIHSFTTAPEVELGVESPDNQPIASGSSVSFDPVFPGGFSQLTLTLRNDAPWISVTGISASVTGADASDFQIISVPATTLPSGNPAATTTCVIKFSPTIPGAKTATLLVASNDPDENPYEGNNILDSVVVFGRFHA
jgi:uncharacterized repeat protein (TIGR03803 family)